MSAMSWRRLALRIKLTVVFAGVMGAVLALIGSFLSLRTRDNLDSAIRDSLRTRSGDLVQSARVQLGSGSGRLIEHGERFAQILNPNGQILDSRPQDAPPLLRRDELGRARRGPEFIERHEKSRLLVAPMRVRGKRLITVVNASLADREHAIEGLGGALLIGGPLALLLASALAYFLAGAALRPVELMRRRASGITSANLHARLPAPETDDEIHRLAITLNEMLERLARAAERERAFIANASHELRTPIAAIRGELELAATHATTIEEFREAARAAIADADQLGQLSEDLLTLAQADHDGLPLALDEVRVDSLLEAAAAELARDPLLAGRALTLRPSGLWVKADTRQLSRAMRNMTRNALLHGTGKITFGALPDGDMAELWVSDEGAHLNAELLDSALERFTRSPESMERPGTGLGLAIVRDIARAHGGDARLGNEDGGVRCTIRIPLASSHHPRPNVARGT